MTKVYFQSDGSSFNVAAKDHASGSEVACAGVSAVMYELAGYLVNAQRAGIVWDVSGHLKSGDAVQAWSGGIEAKTAYDMTRIGLMQIAKSYPQFVEIVVDDSFVSGREA